MLKSFSSFPLLFSATKVSLYSPLSFKLPLMTPFSAFRERPAGRFLTLNLMGRSPEAGMRKITGDPGRTPITAALLMRGVAGAMGVRMYLGA